MPLTIPNAAPTLFIRRSAYEGSRLNRAALDERLGLTPEEFRVEGSLVALGPIVGDESLSDIIAELEANGLAYYEDFFELSGNWPEWLRLLAAGA
jgi:hypothetical protein